MQPIVVGSAQKILAIMVRNAKDDPFQRKNNRAKWTSCAQNYIDGIRSSSSGKVDGLLIGAI